MMMMMLMMMNKVDIILCQTRFIINCYCYYVVSTNVMTGDTTEHSVQAHIYMIL